MLFQRFEKQLLKDLEIEKIEQVPYRELALVLACSGGTDSAALLFLLYEFQKKYEHRLKIKLIVAYFNHQMREESFREAEDLENLCQQLHLIYETQSLKECVERLSEGQNEKVKTFLPLKEKRENIFDLSEEAARSFRYLFLEDVCKKYGGAFLCLAHHQEDQAESLLLHLKRGCGLQGLAGMQTRENRKLRPLLPFHKIELEEDLKKRSLAHLGYIFEPFQDLSNQDLSYQRNYLRHQVLPIIAQEEKVENLAEKISALSEDVRKTQKLLSVFAKQWFDERTLVLEKNGIILQRRLTEEEEVLLPFFLQYMSDLFFEGERLKNLSRSYLNQISKAFQGKEAKSIVFQKGYAFLFEFDKVYFGKEENLLDLVNQNRFLIFNEESLKKGNLQIDFIEKKIKLVYNNKSYIYSLPPIFQQEREMLFSLRRCCTGDRYVLGKHTKAIKRYFEDYKIPKTLRGQILCLAQNQNIIFLENRGEKDHV